jgi:hypothetical protein
LKLLEKNWIYKRDDPRFKKRRLLKGATVLKIYLRQLLFLLQKL